MGRVDVGGNRSSRPSGNRNWAWPSGIDPRAGTSLKDLHILARGCHGTWLPRVTDSDRTQSCRDCICRGGVSARGGEFRRAQSVDREARRGHPTDPVHKPSRSQIPICIPFRNEALFGIAPGVAGASLGNPGLGYAFPSGMVRPGGWSAREGRGTWGRFGNSRSSPHWKRSVCRNRTPPEMSPCPSSRLIDHNPCLVK